MENLVKKQSFIGYWRRQLRDPKVRVAYLFIAVPTLLVLIFRLIPVFVSLPLSFLDYDILTPSKFVGIKNYSALVDDRIFWLSLKNVFYYVVGTVPVSMIIGLLLAVAVYAKWFKGREIMRAIYFIPVIISMTVVSLIFIWIYNPSYGALNAILNTLGLPSVMWLGPQLAMPMVIFMSIWKSLGYYMVIYLAGLTSIPQQLYEAAELDGATKLQQFKSITIPLLLPVTLFLSVLGIIGAFQVFDQIYVLTAGGPMHKTTVVVYYIWQNAFQKFRMGYASAIAWVLFIIMFSLTVTQFKLFGKGAEY